ncbi:MAG: hypothetical protein AN486_15245 [Anabaena sp. AL93]|nr:MAG: hypothetical protein AN486_15245 [Anabaena sp. AL93]
MWGAIAKRDLGIAVWDVESAIAKRCCKQFAFGRCGENDSEALLQAVRFWDVWSAIAKRDLGIAFWDVGNAIAKRDLGIAC